MALATAPIAKAGGLGPGNSSIVLLTYAAHIVLDKVFRFHLQVYFISVAGVAQLARASRCHREGRGFESPFPLHFYPLRT